MQYIHWDAAEKRQTLKNLDIAVAELSGTSIYLRFHFKNLSSPFWKR